jgi:hypothetical protein
VWAANRLTDGGLWLEALVYLRALAQRPADRKDRKVRASLKVRDMDHPRLPAFESEAKNHHEIDLIVTGPGSLHVVECKSGEVKQEALTKQEVIRARLQGRNGITAIVSRQVAGLDDILGQKAKSAGLTWISYETNELDPLILKMFA